MDGHSESGLRLERCGQDAAGSKCRVCTAIASTVAGTRTQSPLLRTPEPQGRVGYRHY